MSAKGDHFAEATLMDTLWFIKKIQKCFQEICHTLETHFAWHEAFDHKIYFTYCNLSDTLHWE